MICRKIYILAIIISKIAPDFKGRERFFWILRELSSIIAECFDGIFVADDLAVLVYVA